MPYIEDVLPLDFEIKVLNCVKWYVHEARVGCVHIGSIEACRQYVRGRRQARMTGADPATERYGRINHQIK